MLLFKGLIISGLNEQTERREWNISWLVENSQSLSRRLFIF
jgi:hypothetical protein